MEGVGSLGHSEPRPLRSPENPPPESLLPAPLAGWRGFGGPSEKETEMERPMGGKQVVTHQDPLLLHEPIPDRNPLTFFIYTSNTMQNI